MTQKKKMRTIPNLSIQGSIITIFLFLLPSYSASTQVHYYQGKPAKYIFLFIGNGMGLAQRTVAEKYKGTQLVMGAFPAHGITATHAANRFITGSAAAGTALSTGQKTNIGMLGVTPKQKPVKTIAEIARDKGQKVGIISSVSLDHASPAAFYAHVTSRNYYRAIERALVTSDFDFFAGGTIFRSEKQNGIPAKLKGRAEKIIKTAGYKIIKNKEEFSSLSPEDGKIYAYNTELADNQSMPYAIDMGPDDISLAQLTSKAIELLDNPQGFFLLVEEGKIDWACHANDAATAIHNILILDKAIKKAVDFAQLHTDETLIVVTANHETGGLTLGWAGTQYETELEILDHQGTSFQKFSDDIFTNYYRKCGQNCSFESVKPIIKDCFGLKFAGNRAKDPMVLLPHEIRKIKVAFKESLIRKKTTTPAKNILYGDYNPLVMTLTRCLNNKAGLDWTTFSHTAVPVITSAFGVGADTFNGAYDNTEVAKKIMAVMGVEPKVYAISTQKILNAVNN